MFRTSPVLSIKVTSGVFLQVKHLTTSENMNISCMQLRLSESDIRSTYMYFIQTVTVPQIQCLELVTHVGSKVGR